MGRSVFESIRITTNLSVSNGTPFLYKIIIKAMLKNFILLILIIISVITRVLISLELSLCVLWAYVIINHFFELLKSIKDIEIKKAQKRKNKYLTY